MINSYFKTTINKPSTQSFYGTSRLTAEKTYLQNKFKKYKLIVLLLSRSTFKTLKISFDAVAESSKTLPQALAKFSLLCERNTNLTVYLAFDRIKIAASQQRTNERLIKDMVNLLQRMEKYKMKQSFGKLVLYSSRSGHAFI